MVFLTLCFSRILYLIFYFDILQTSSPYETDADCKLVKHAVESVLQVTGMKGKLSTSGGTSDGRFLAAAGAQVIELGPSYKTIHKVNEHVHLDDLEILCRIYENLLERLTTLKRRDQCWCRQ